jgi:hypothetical protein
MEPQRRPGQGVDGHDDAVERGCGSLACAGAQCLAEDLRGIRDEHHRHEEDQIPVEEPTVDPLDIREDGVVVEPHDSDDEEADHVRSQ